ncbi:fasciclin domain-containing protein [uncultured Mucilaginibacter sp.]|uniref:fasciclin domain-containing protein n=1 Tax=uncultured Mucilaginibacter sp. TaxID=797541 RepID=UPI0025FA8783|nr:fasciclin domain-containing protein [uncultured Mucilaginibacter sp.]
MRRIFDGMPAILLVLGFMTIIGLNSCKREALTYTTTSTVNMYTYIGQNPDYSLFKQIIDKAGYAGYLDAYGAYTLFVSNNAGVNAYLKANNKTSVDALDEATAKKIIAVSMLADTLNSSFFKDGKLRTPTQSGQYIITGTRSVNGVTSVVINKQANFVTGNIKTGNGLIHVVDNVLFPAELTLAKTLEQNPKYSIFTTALKETGFYDTLNVASAANTNASRKFLTLIAETDSAFNANGIASYNALKAKYSTKGNPRDHADSLWLFCAYRVWPELAYLSDIATSTAHATLAPLEVTTSQLSGQTVLLNNDTFNGVLEPGIALDRNNSDVSANNGVLHRPLGSYKIKVRFPTPVYFDVANQPEIRRSGIYRVPGQSKIFNYASLSEVVLVGPANDNNRLEYKNTAATPGPEEYYYGNDYVNIGLRFRTGANASNTSQATFTTPVIVKGRYKIWVDYKYGTGSQSIPVSFDGVTLPNILNPNDALIYGETEAQAESRGFKSYSEWPIASFTKAPTHVGRLVGIVNVPTTARHTITFTSTACTGCAVQFQLDAVEFRPVDMDQLKPKLGRSGALIP